MKCIRSPSFVQPRIVESEPVCKICEVPTCSERKKETMKKRMFEERKKK
jgi:hypothetical protein